VRKFNAAQVDEMSFEEAKQYLRREDDQGNSLYEHLSRVLLKVIVEKPENVNETFEQISQELRGTLHGSKSLLLAESNPQVAMSDEVSQLQWCNSAIKLHDPPTEAVEVSYPNLITEANVCEWAGIHLGRSATYRLYLAIKQKSLIEGQSLRFWGKIVGRSGNYFVIQGDNLDTASAESLKDIEGTEGTNKYSFWVCAFVGGEWTKLPNATPEAIVITRQIKRFFTGNLDAPVPSYPPFPGSTEAHLLRAQIALITAECSVSPAGFYTEDDAGEGIRAIKKVDGSEEMKSLQELKDTASWVHHELPINANGRCNQPPATEEGDNTEPTEELPELPLLGSISDDKIADGPAWGISVKPDGMGESPDSVVVVKSLKWPGAFAAAFGDRYVNIYCGFGFASSHGTVYEPPSVPHVATEWVQAEQQNITFNEEADEITQPVAEEPNDKE
jgi:radial spoke head protein 4A|tara:strand:+ start:49 stop:1383 length:1335 start_codon:yes stop_codon:yes gene_type:complete